MLRGAGDQRERLAGPLFAAVTRVPDITAMRHKFPQLRCKRN
jgi:hypothetical protein